MSPVGTTADLPSTTRAATFCRRSLPSLLCAITLTQPCNTLTFIGQHYFNAFYAGKRKLPRHSTLRRCPKCTSTPAPIILNKPGKEAQQQCVLKHVQHIWAAARNSPSSSFAFECA